MAQQPLGIQVQLKGPSAGSWWAQFTGRVQHAVAGQPTLNRAATWLHRAPTWEAVAAVAAAALAVYIVAQAASRLASSILKVAVLVAAVAAVYLFVVH